VNSRLTKGFCAGIPNGGYPVNQKLDKLALSMHTCVCTHSDAAAAMALLRSTFYLKDRFNLI